MNLDSLRAEYDVIPIVRRLSADTITPVAAFAALSDLAHDAFLLESVERGENVGRYSFIGVAPRRKLTFERDCENPIALLREELVPLRVFDEELLPPFFGGAVGFFGYGVSRWSERLPDAHSNDTSIPDGTLLFIDQVICFDHVKQELIVVANIFTKDERSSEELVAEANEKLDLIIGKLRTAKVDLLPALRRDAQRASGTPSPSNDIANAERVPSGTPSPSNDIANAERVPDAHCASLRGATQSASVTPSASDDIANVERVPDAHCASLRGATASWSSNMSREAFLEMVRRAKEEILAGEIFQVVVSQRWSSDFPTREALALYRTLRSVNPSPYMFLLRTDACTLVGSSPEMLVRLDNGIAENRPIAGTRRRGANAAEDRALEAELLADPKERAEHLMLVDLGRNDLGRVCESGSVRVSDYAHVERYSHVMHIVSNVEGKLRGDMRAIDLFLATFPAGTVSGAPKIRAMELIDTFEPTRRGPYAGAVAYFGFSGSLDSCISIRTAILKNDRVHIQAGAGIVYDSVAESEYEETRTKSMALRRAVELTRERIGLATELPVGAS